MEIHLPPALTLALPRGTAAALAPAWRSGQLLEALVTRSDPGRGSALLQIGNERVEARSPLPLAAGQRLHLLVEVQAERMLLRVVTPQPETAATTAALRQALPRQGPVAPVFEQLARLLQPPAGEPARQLPAAVRAVLNEALAQAPMARQLTSAHGLQQALRGSGLFLEAQLARTAAPPPTDLKGALLRLLAQLTAAARNPATLSAAATSPKAPTHPQALPSAPPPPTQVATPAPSPTTSMPTAPTTPTAPPAQPAPTTSLATTAAPTPAAAPPAPAPAAPSASAPTAAHASGASASPAAPGGAAPTPAGAPPAPAAPVPGAAGQTYPATPPPPPPLPGAAAPRPAPAAPTPANPPSTAPEPASAAPTRTTPQAPARPAGTPAGAAAPDPELPQLLRALIRDTEGALARVQLHQLRALPDAGGQDPQWVMELPVRHDDGFSSLILRIRRERESEREPGQGAGWNVALDLGDSDCGPLRAVVALHTRRISVRFFAERPETAARIHAQLPLLEQRLRALGLEVRTMESLAGPAPPEEPAPTPPLLNERA